MLLDNLIYSLKDLIFIPCFGIYFPIFNLLSSTIKSTSFFEIEAISKSNVAFVGAPYPIIGIPSFLIFKI